MVVHDPGVVTRCQPARAGAAREGEQLCEAEAAVAARARVGRVTARVTPDEWFDDGAPELFPQVEGHVRNAERVAGLPRGNHSRGRAANPLGARTVRVGPEPERDADRVRASPQQRNRRVDPAAHRHRHADRRRSGSEDGPDRVRKGVHRQRLPADGGRLEQAQPPQVGVEPVRVGIDDPVALDAQPDERPAAVTRRVTCNLGHLTQDGTRLTLSSAAQAPHRRSDSPTLGGGVAPYPCVERNEENVKRLLLERDDRGTNAKARRRKMCPDPADVSAP